MHRMRTTLLQNRRLFERAPGLQQTLAACGLELQTPTCGLALLILTCCGLALQIPCNRDLVPQILRFGPALLTP